MGRPSAAPGPHPILQEHLDRLFEGARALDLDVGLDREQIKHRIEELLAANGMEDGVHIRLMVTRGIKSTPYQDPRLTVGPATMVIIPEYKAQATFPKPLTLFTAHVRRGAPDVQDAKWNSHSKLNCISACIQAAKAGADEALMLDPHGFVATCNSTNFFIVRRDEVWTSTPKYCINGITRSKVLLLCEQNGIPFRETDFSLTNVYGATEAFVTGTFGGLTPVAEVDGRPYEQPVAGADDPEVDTVVSAAIERNDMTEQSVRIAMWSGPRNISTALMRSWENRGDTSVVDEPLYAAYLSTTGTDHPGRNEIIAAGETDWRRVVEILVDEPVPMGRHIFYQKHMCHHLLPGMDLGWTSSLTNCFLIREPAEVLASYLLKRDNPSLEDLGFPQQLHLFQRVRADGELAPVIDAARVLQSPRGVLRTLCESIAVPFDEAMLSWPSGPRSSDGTWAKHWYGAVEQSTGFKPYAKRTPDIPARYGRLVKQATEIYQELLTHHV